MAKMILSKRKANALSFALFLGAIAILTLIKSWWPGIMLAVGLPLALNQYLLGKMYDMAISLFVFIGVFITVTFNINWDILLPVLFVTGGVYIFVKEFFGPKEETEEEKEEEKNKEFEDKD